ncbi:hypothetical protein ACO0K3_03585 [Undibacterium sp. Rencai35W]|uniref:hypothetical protein n=1 Tax=Undibacterium sp. Rencai35W TaxID=3413046 RepID=UPI003BF2BD66
MAHLIVFGLICALGFWMDKYARNFYASVMGFVVWSIGFIGSCTSVILLFVTW